MVFLVNPWVFFAYCFPFPLSLRFDCSLHGLRDCIMKQRGGDIVNIPRIYSF